jgi:predicted 2-oxoglutarate/Fe(II)-dependent dioxygenase YbiX
MDNRMTQASLTKVAEGIFTMPEFFPAEECSRYINHSEEIGFELATLNTVGGIIVDETVRNNSRVIVDDPELAVELWRKLREKLPTFLDGHQAIGINERFRFYRYESSQRFVGHVDGKFRRENGEESRLTFMIYLNDDFVGGETAFNDVVITPQRGTALIFRHELFHEGRPVAKGRKYVLRSDVMFNPIGRFSG